MDFSLLISSVGFLSKFLKAFFKIGRRYCSYRQKNQLTSTDGCYLLSWTGESFPQVHSHDMTTRYSLQMAFALGFSL